MNWDLIPQIAIADIVMMSNNPAYGLNALEGAVNVIMKDGFRFQGATVDTRFGSFGHKEVAAEKPARSGVTGQPTLPANGSTTTAGATSRPPRPSGSMPTSASRARVPSFT